MHTGFHNEIVYVPMKSFLLPLSVPNTLLFRFLSKASLAIRVVLWWIRLAFYSHGNAPFSKGRAIPDSTVSGPQSKLSPSHLSSSAKGFGRVAAKYNSKSERNRELLRCTECNQLSALSTQRHQLIKDSVGAEQGSMGRWRSGAPYRKAGRLMSHRLALSSKGQINQCFSSGPAEIKKSYSYLSTLISLVCRLWNIHTLLNIDYCLQASPRNWSTIDKDRKICLLISMSWCGSSACFSLRPRPVTSVGSHSPIFGTRLPHLPDWNKNFMYF